MKILTIVGARPQFIKAAALSHRLRARHHELLLHTGQHYDELLSARFFTELELPAPDIDLNVGSGLHGEQTARMLAGIEQAIVTHAPDRVLVYGDTNSTLAGALAAAKLHVPVAHIEAGLRSFNRRMPEEINRIVVDQLSDLLLCPSPAAAQNLAREGVASGVHIVGDVMADAVQRFAPSSDQAMRLVMERGFSPQTYYVATVHRAENTDDTPRLAAIVRGFAEIGQPIAFPAHPRVRRALAEANVAVPANVRLMDPLGYREMLAFVREARAVLTDSGGLQKEAYWLAVPCITLRDETEWVETVSTGWNRVAGATVDGIVSAVLNLVRPDDRPPLYGEGEAVDRIVSLLGPGVAAAATA